MEKWIKCCQEETGRDNFYPWKFERVSNAILATGGECPEITRGKNKGEPNYRKAINITKVMIPLGILND